MKLTWQQQLTNTSRARSDRRGSEAVWNDAHREHEERECAREPRVPREVDEADTQARYDEKDWKENHT